MPEELSRKRRLAVRLVRFTYGVPAPIATSPGLRIGVTAGEGLRRDDNLRPRGNVAIVEAGELGDGREVYARLPCAC
jgi:hypothetical protein